MTSDTVKTEPLADFIRTHGRLKAILLALTLPKTPTRPRLRDVGGLPAHLVRDVGLTPTYEKPPDPRMRHF